MQIEPPSDAPWEHEISSNGSGLSIPQCGLISVPLTVLRGRVGEHLSILAALGDSDRNALSKNRNSDEFNRRDYLPPASALYVYLCFSSTNRQSSQAMADYSAFRVQGVPVGERANLSRAPGAKLYYMVMPVIRSMDPSHLTKRRADICPSCRFIIIPTALYNWRIHTTANKMAYRQNTAEITRRKQQTPRSQSQRRKGRLLGHIACSKADSSLVQASRRKIPLAEAQVYDGDTQITQQTVPNTLSQKEPTKDKT
ncbi:MAG: hypothetical protein Q9228_004596 [Teloschistes exilis]